MSDLLKELDHIWPVEQRSQTVGNRQRRLETVKVRDVIFICDDPAEWTVGDESASALMIFRSVAPAGSMINNHKPCREDLTYPKSS